MIQDVTNSFANPNDARFFVSWAKSNLPTDATSTGSNAEKEFNGYFLERAGSSTDIISLQE